MRGFHQGPDPGKEQGFVLIAAVWLLILAGSITAILMLRSISAATLAADQQEMASRKLVLEGAIETALADRLFGGPRSRWWLVPSEGPVTIAGRQVIVTLTSESGRLDVNRANPDLIDTALRGFGMEPSERARIAGQLATLREGESTIGSHSELAALFGQSRNSTASCLLDHFTISSGLAEPSPGQITPELARALGRAGGQAAVQPAQAEPGAALRVRAAEADGGPLTAIVRVAGTIDQPLSVSAWATASPCEKARR